MQADADLIVVGSGIAGTAVTRAARERGVSVLLLDGRRPEAASPAAEGIVRVGWVPKAQQGLARRSLDLLRSWGVLVEGPASISSWQWPEEKRQEDADYAACDVRRTLLEPDVVTEIVSVIGKRVVDHTGRTFWAGTAVVVATGALAMGLGYVPASARVRTTWGATVVSGEVLQHRTRFRVHRLRPYTCASLVSHPSMTDTRLGSTTANKQERAIEMAYDFRHSTPGDMRALFLDRTRLLTGQRLHVTPSIAGHFSAPYWWHPNGAGVTFAGLAKNGYTLAPALGEEIVETLWKR